MHGGKALASGSFGCVFKPSLATTASPAAATNTVSKLMARGDAEEEYAKTQWLTPILQQEFPTYESYFILPSQPAQPLELQPGDLVNFTSTCQPFFHRVPRVFRGGVKRSASRSLSRSSSPVRQRLQPPQDARVPGQLTADNVNRNLSQLLVINQIDGGDALFDVFADGVDEQKLVSVLQSLAQLAMGVEQLSELNIMHMDVKVENVVYDGRLSRLIDWGLAARTVDYVTEDEGPGLSERLFAIVRPLPPGSLLLPSRLQQQLQRVYVPHIVSPTSGTHFEQHVYGDALATWLVASKQFNDTMLVGNQAADIAEWLHQIAPALPTAHKARLLDMGDRVKVLGTEIAHEGVRTALMDMDSLVAGVYFCQVREIVERYSQLLPSGQLFMFRGKYIRNVFVPNADLHGLVTSLYVLLMDTMQFAAGYEREVRVRRFAGLLMYKYLYSGMFATTVIDSEQVVADLRSLARVTRGETVVEPAVKVRASKAERLVSTGIGAKEVEEAAARMVRELSGSVMLDL